MAWVVSFAALHKKLVLESMFSDRLASMSLQKTAPDKDPAPPKKKRKLRWKRVRLQIIYSYSALRERHKRRWLYMKIVAALYSLAALFFAIPSPTLVLSKRTRAIIVLSLVIVALLFVIEALYQLYRKRVARLRLRHKSTLETMRDKYERKIRWHENEAALWNERHSEEIEQLNAANLRHINDEQTRAQFRYAEIRQEGATERTKLENELRVEKSHRATIVPLREKVSGLESQLEELTTQKLKFEIGKLRDSRAYLIYIPDLDTDVVDESYGITSSFKIRFINEDTSP
ncbi:MAG: hypothetical protein WCB68_23135, partial [Pyrinomonadaceae bacterium]